MGLLETLVEHMRNAPTNVRYIDLCKVCVGKAKQTSGSHRVYKTPWPGDPRGNIQSEKGKAKAYQVRQVLKAIEKLEGRHDAEE